MAWRSRSVAALGIAMTLLAATAAIVGQARYDGEASQRQRYQQLVGQQFEEQPDRHPHRVSHYGYLVFRPRAPLGFFDSGVEHFAGTSIFLEAHRQNTANFSAAAQGGASERFGELTLATVLQLLVPLFIFAVAGVSVTREREQGTLPLLLCQGASWSHLLWGKFLGTLLIVGAVVAPGLLMAIVWLALRAEVVWDADLVTRGALLLMMHTVFLAACTAVALAVSAVSTTSRGALVVLIGLWFALWIVLPRVLPAVATSLYPVPARAAFDAEVDARVKELGDSHNPNDPMFTRLREETLRQYGVSRVEDLPFNYGGLVMRESEQLTSDTFRAHLARLVDTYQRQSRLVEAAGVVSPYLAVRLASMALSGSDTAHQLEFERQAEEYRFRLIQSLNALHMNEVDAGADRYGALVNGAPSRRRIDAAYFDDLPAFDFARPAVGWSLRQQTVGLTAGALGIAGALGWLAWIAARGARLT